MTWLYYFKNYLLLLLLISICLIQSCDKSKDVVEPDPEETPNDPDWIDYEGPIPIAGSEVCLVVGQTRKAGTVEIAVEGEFLLITTKVSKEDTYLKKIYLEIFSSLEELEEEGKLVEDKLVFGNFDFKKTWESGENVSTYTVKLPLSDITILDDCFNIAVQVALTNSEVAWGVLCQENNPGITIDDSNKFPGSAWSVYIEFCPEESVFNLDYTYAWEDKNNFYIPNSPNDADYNDLVIQSDVLKTDGKLKITFLAAARGASLDHSFKIKINKTGVVLSNNPLKSPLIFGADKIEEIGELYYITVFNSTKAILPAENYPNTGFASNTSQDDDTCEPIVLRSVTIMTDENYIFNPDFPFDPFIRVLISNDFTYDLNIWELHKTDGTGSIWENEEGKLMPNGIIIYDKWKWLIERKVITNAYPDFTSITDGWNEDWASNLADPSLVWTCE